MLKELNEHFKFSGVGSDSLYFQDLDFEHDDIFFSIPLTHFFVTYNDYNKKIKFFKIVNSPKEVPKNVIEVFEKFSENYSLDLDFECYYCQIPPDDIIE